MGGKMSSNYRDPIPNINYFFPDMNPTDDIINFFPKNSKKEVSRDFCPSLFYSKKEVSVDLYPSSFFELILSRLLNRMNEASRDPSPSPADKFLPPDDILKKDTISDIPSPSPADNLHIPRSPTDDDHDILKKKKETPSPSPADNDLCPRVGVFSDFGKKAREILNKDYYNNYSNPNKEKIFFGLGTRSRDTELLFTAYPRTEGLSLGKFSATASNNSNNSAEIKTNAELNGFSTQIVSEIVPTTFNGFISMEFPDLNGSSKVGFQCLFPPYGTLTAATFTSTTLYNNLSTFHYSGTIGYGHLSIGGDFVIRDPYVDIQDYSGRISFVNSDFDATIGFTDKGETLNASCVHYLDEMKKSCVVAEFKRNLSTNENTLTIGGTIESNYKKTTLLKAKVDNHGKMGVVLQQQLFKDTKIRICSEFNHKDCLNKTPMIGLSLIL